MAALPWTSLAGQAAVRGVLFDSVRTMAPLANAEVVLEPGGLRSTTDARGRFAFERVAAGSYVLSYAPLWLDSVGVPPVTQRLELGARGARSTALVIRSRAELAARVCGGVMDADRGVVVGEVRDASGAAAAGAIVWARWSEQFVGAARADAATEYVALDTTGADGRFGLCGMREQSEVVVFGRHPDGRQTGVMALVVAPAVVAFDLVLGDTASRHRVRGRTVNAAGVALPNVDIFGTGATRGVMRSDSLGWFEVAVPAGSRQLAFRTLGFVPRLLEVRSGGDELDLGQVVLEPVPTVLDTMVIRARAMTRQEMEFEERRRVGMGSFLDETILRRAPAVTPAYIAANSRSWVRAFPTKEGDLGGIFFRKGTGFCVPRLYVDGYDWGNRTGADEIRGLLQIAKRIEMHRSTFTPAEFVDFDDCGALVIWLH